MPAGLGFSLCGVAYAGFFSANQKAQVRSLCSILCGTALLIMLIFWGYSSDGLGRNCLEPLLFLVLVVAVLDYWRRLLFWPIGIFGVYLEGRWMETWGFVGHPGFVWGAVPLASWICWLISSSIGLVIVLRVLRTYRNEAQT